MFSMRECLENLWMKCFKNDENFFDAPKNNFINRMKYIFRKEKPYITNEEKKELESIEMFTNESPDITIPQKSFTVTYECTNPSHIIKYNGTIYRLEKQGRVDKSSKIEVKAFSE